MPLSRLSTYLSCFFILLNSFNVYGLNVTFINPGFSNTADGDNNTGNFWFKVSNQIQNVADDLAINLTVKYANRNHILMKELIRQAVIDNPDYLILVDEKSVASEYLTKLNTKDIPIYFLLNKPDPDKLATLHRDDLNIIGSVIPDNYNAGKDLAHLLFNKHTLTSNQPANMLALLGDYTTAASIERAQGLQRFAEQKQSLNIVAQDVANWSEDESYIKTMAFLQLAPEINIIWCANDAIGFGAKRAIKKLKKQNILVGGVNWDAPPKDLTPLDVSLGGHVLLGALGLITIYDHHQDPIKWPASHQVTAIFKPLSSENKELAKRINNNKLKDIDFRMFSKTSASWRPFTIDNLLDAANY
ncbi:sugar ABC transporter substrate-binding protein [Pseudoalteromonas sp. A601]|uniref:ABC transporter substrate-binding protein n=1 Tax=Pseudoalteromonas sp. A601 TaxID=1967839 RepID=UPI000B3D04DB|nr:ABC transporter substrate-binding protein [Pseudoalteromonas sp. A601]OUS69173.1 sugar ABC transporter substrate-binding protein [Pseudoalteromonas sp. A601]